MLLSGVAGDQKGDSTSASTITTSHSDKLPLNSWDKAAKVLSDTFEKVKEVA